MAAFQKNLCFNPYERNHKEKPSSVDSSDDTRISKVVSNFVLGKQPYTQLTVGLCGLDVDIRFIRNGAPYFELSANKIQELSTFNERVTLSSTPTDGGTLICVSQPNEKGLLIERILEPFTCAMDFNDCRMVKFELSRYETKQLEKHLPHIKNAIATIDANKPAFDCMYGLIVTAMLDIHSRMNSNQDVIDMYDEIGRMLLYIPRSYFVREYLNHAGNSKTPYQLFSVVETCQSQHAYLKKRLKINSFLNWEKM